MSTVWKHVNAYLVRWLMRKCKSLARRKVGRGAPSGDWRNSFRAPLSIGDLANLIRGCLSEFGIVAPLGIIRVSELIAIIRDETDERLLLEARIAMSAVADQLHDLQARIKEIGRAIKA
jgi:hypothetical protein